MLSLCRELTQCFSQGDNSAIIKFHLNGGKHVQDFIKKIPKAELHIHIE